MIQLLKNLWIRIFGSNKRWEIGPIIDGKNQSIKMPKEPKKSGDGWYFDFPNPKQANGHVHYVTYGYGSLKGKSQITLKYKIDMDDGVEIKPLGIGNFPSIITMYFQRRGDNWSGVKEYEAYRWYATFAYISPITAGEHSITVPFSGNWTAVQHSQSASAVDKFKTAMEKADRVGFVFGGNTGFGHGVYATGPARFTMQSFEIS